MARTQLDRKTLEAALIGLQLQQEQIDKRMTEIRRQLGGRDTHQPAGATEPARHRRRLSAAARKRIAAAQKKRWAAYRKQEKAA